MHALLEVPVFVLQLDRPVPVLIDQHYNAKALEDMILVVQVRYRIYRYFGSLY